MKIRTEYKLTGWVIPVILCICALIFPKPLIFLAFIFIDILIHERIACPNCKTKISSFYNPKSKNFKGLRFGFRFRFPDKCPNCGCDWE
ncbi:MAG: hypothetical protein J6T20_01420 [Treponema sp.]|nr:hypothetical protein [Treponema sp.]